MERPKFDILVSEYQFGLKEEQQKLVEDYVEGKIKTTVAGICRRVYGKPIKDDSEEAGIMKNFINKLKRGVFHCDLSDSQIEYVNKNYKSMRPTEMAMELFPDKDIFPLSPEVKSIDLYCKSIRGFDDEDFDREDQYALYHPPIHDGHIIGKINRVAPNASYSKKLTLEQRKNVDALKGYLKSPLFIQKINSFNKLEQRELFENTFVQATYDKCDLNSEDLNQYVSLCEEYVMASVLQRHLLMLDEQIEKYSGSDEVSDLATVLRLSGAYESKQKEYDACKKRQEILQKNLSSTRSERKKHEKDASKSLHAIVNSWMTEEGRMRALVIANARNEELKREKVRLETFDDYIANMVGFSEEELLHN